MSRTMYACAWAAEFPTQALIRLRTDWQTEPVAVLDGRAPEEWVYSMNRLAGRHGVVAGMTRLEAESVNGLRLLKRSAESEIAAREVFLECAAKFSPRIEEACAGAACAFVLDIAGTERLFGPPAQLAERLREELAGAGFRASVAVSANYDTARMKAASIHGIAVIPEGSEAEALARLPIAALDLDEEYATTFALWGIGTLGELTALPEAELVARVRPQARRWRGLARGEAAHAFVPIEAEFALDEFCEFEAPVEQIDSLLFVGARMIDCLVTRAAGRALALRALTAEMALERGGTHCIAIRPAVPSTDRRFLLKLLQLEIGAHPPQAAVVSLTLHAEAGAQNKMQLGLFAAQTPEPSRLDVTLARLRAMVGEERVGSPILEDTHGEVLSPESQNRDSKHARQKRSRHGSEPADRVAARAAAASGPGGGVTHGDGISTTPDRPTHEASSAQAGLISRWRAHIRDCCSVWTVEDERLLVVSGRMGHRGVGCTRHDQQRRHCSLPVDARLRTECVATGGILRLTAASMFRTHARLELPFAIPTMSIGRQHCRSRCVFAISRNLRPLRVITNTSNCMRRVPSAFWLAHHCPNA